MPIITLELFVPLSLLLLAYSPKDCAGNIRQNRSDAIIYKLRIAAEFLISSSRCELIYKFEFLFEKAAMSCKTTLIVYFD